MQMAVLLEVSMQERFHADKSFPVALTIMSFEDIRSCDLLRDRRP